MKNQIKNVFWGNQIVTKFYLAIQVLKKKITSLNLYQKLGAIFKQVTCIIFANCCIPWLGSSGLAASTSLSPFKSVTVLKLLHHTSPSHQPALHEPTGAWPGVVLAAEARLSVAVPWCPLLQMEAAAQRWRWPGPASDLHLAECGLAELGWGLGGTAAVTPLHNNTSYGGLHIKPHNFP